MTTNAVRIQKLIRVRNGERTTIIEAIEPPPIHNHMPIMWTVFGVGLDHTGPLHLQPGDHVFVESKPPYQDEVC